MLDNFETVLEDGLVKLCRSAGLLDSGMLQSSPDIDSKWKDEYLEAYVADAVENFNSYPESTVAWPAFLGMAVAHNWDTDWERHSRDRYCDYYGLRGFDDMDEHILSDILGLDAAAAARLSDSVSGCAVAALSLVRHEGIEAQTADGFFVLVRIYCVMFRLGSAMELKRLGYRMVNGHQSA